MAQVCQVTEASDYWEQCVRAHNKTRRRFSPNLHYHRFWVESISASFVFGCPQKASGSLISAASMWSLVSFALAAKRSQGDAMRDKIKLVSSAGTGHYYTTDKNKKNTPDKLEFKKFDPVVRKHVIYKEAKIK